MRHYILTAAGVALLVAIPFFTIAAIRKKRFSFSLFARYLLVAYGACLVFYTILFTGLGSGGGGVNLQLYIPFVTTETADNAEMMRWFNADEYIYNIVLFLPFGVLLPLNFPKINRIYKVVALAFCCTLFIELVQRLIGRAFDVNDIVANTLGGLAGACVFLPVLWLHNAVKRKALTRRNKARRSEK